MLWWLLTPLLLSTGDLGMLSLVFAMTMHELHILEKMPGRTILGEGSCPPDKCTSRNSSAPCSGFFVEFYRFNETNVLIFWDVDWKPGWRTSLGWLWWSPTRWWPRWTEEQCSRYNPASNKHGPYYMVVIEIHLQADPKKPIGGNIMAHASTTRFFQADSCSDDHWCTTGSVLERGGGSSVWPRFMTALAFLRWLCLFVVVLFWCWLCFPV